MIKTLEGAKIKIFNNLKVVENYFFMTTLQLLNSIFGIIIYPYLIRTLGPESFGLFVFAISITSYFIGIVSFGFSYPAIKKIIAYKDNIGEKNNIISSVISAKLYIAIFTTFLFSLSIIFIPVMYNNWILYTICYLQVFSEVLSFYWYFQSIQKMRILTYIQSLVKIASLPFVFIFIKSSSDNWIYALIITSTLISSNLISLYYLKTQENFRFKLQSFKTLKYYFNESLPFFWSNSTEIIKQESVTIIIGLFLGMKDVALYDLANKIIMLPRVLTVSINSALLPKIIENTQKKIIRKILQFEVYLGLAIILGVIIFGYWIVIFLGGKSMLASYPLSIILSFTVLVWLVIGSYVNFIFVPANKYKFVSYNQYIAFISFIILCIPAVLFFKDIISIVIALSLSGLFEIIYCNYIVKKHKLL